MTSDANAMTSTNRSFRRVVTGHNGEGRSVVLFDESSPHRLNFAGLESFPIVDIWRTFGTAQDIRGNEDTCGPQMELAPPRGGTTIRMVQFPPDKEYLPQWDRHDSFAGMGESGASALSEDGARHGMTHRTDTIDYVVVLEGEIWALLDEGEVCLRAGDVLVQRGTMHAWSNRSDKPCVYAAILVDAAAGKSQMIGS